MDHSKVRDIEQVVHQTIVSGSIAGMNVLIIKDGEELLYCSDGYADIKNKRPVQRNSIFRLYSMTKPVTAAAAMILVERGLLDLGQPVSDFLPGFRDQKVCSEEKLLPPDRPAIIRDLLNMTAGLVYPGTDGEAEIQTARVFDKIIANLGTDHQVSTVEAANAIGECPLKYQPGKTYFYSSGADVLGAVIEVVSGMKFGDFLQKKIFEPLQMNDTGFYVPKSKADRVVIPYQSTPDGTLNVYKGCNLGVQNDVTKKNAFESGGAGLVSTLDDYASFATMLLDGGIYREKRILSEQTVKFMTEGSLTSGQEKGLESAPALLGHTYGNLMRVLKDPGQALSMGNLGEYGWDGWLGCYFSNDPKERMTILAGVQQTDSGMLPIIRKIRNILYRSSF